MIHILFTLTGCDAALIDSEEHVRQVLFDACQTAKTTWLQTASHKFEPQGVTAVALLAESHISVHSWPETQTAICDIFTCSEESGAKAAMEHMQAAFKATGVECTTTVTRAGSLFTTPGSSHVEAS